jgi:hypothetical protein
MMMMMMMMIEVPEQLELVATVVVTAVDGKVG